MDETKDPDSNIPHIALAPPSAVLQVAIDDSGNLAILRGETVVAELSPGEVYRLSQFIERTRAVWVNKVPKSGTRLTPPREKRQRGAQYWLDPELPEG